MSSKKTKKNKTPLKGPAATMDALQNRNYSSIQYVYPSAEEFKQINDRIKNRTKKMIIPKKEEGEGEDNILRPIPRRSNKMVFDWNKGGKKKSLKKRKTMKKLKYKKNKK